MKFTKEKPWLDYVLAPRLEVACGEAPYLTSRYDTVSGRKISVPDRVGLLDRKLRVVTENVRDPQDWLHYAKRAVQNIYGFDWQGDNVLLARENIVATVIETFTHVFCGGEISDFASFRVFPPIEDEGGDLGLDFAADTVVDDGCARLSRLYLLELAEIVSWNIWQMDGLKFVAPMSCHLEKRLFKTSGGETVTLVSECPGCEKGDNARHNGVYCRVMDWATGRSAGGDVPEEAVKPAETARIWRDVLAKQVFVVCKTPMARSITVRTLAGYDAKATINAQYIPGLVEMLAEAPRKFRDRVCGGNAWNNKEFSMKMLKFDAVVGNPPYQVEVARKASETNGQARRKSIFQYFQMAADEVTSGCTSLVYPGGRWIHRSGKGMEEFGLGQINDPRLAALHFWPDWSELFPTAEIADGLSIVVKEKRKTAPGFKYIYHKGGRRQVLAMPPPGESLMPLDPNDASIIAKIRSFRSKHGLKSIADRVLARSLFGIESDSSTTTRRLGAPASPLVSSTRGRRRKTSSATARRRLCGSSS